MSKSEADKLIADAKGSLDKDPSAALDAASGAKAIYQRLGDRGGFLEAGRLAVAATLAKGDGEGAMQLAMEQLETARQDSDLAKEAAALMTIAEVYLYLGRPAEALTRLKSARVLCQDASDEKLEAKAALVEAQAHMSSGNVADAVKVANQGLGLFQKVRDKEGEASAWHTLASARLMGGQRDVVEPMKKALGLYRELRDRKNEALLWVSLSEAQLMESADEAARSASEAMRQQEDLGNLSGEARALRVLIKARAAQEQPEEGLRAAKDRLERCDKAAKAVFTPVMISALIENEDFEEALTRAEKALQEAREANTVLEEARSLNCLAEVHISRKEYKKAENAAHEAHSLFMERGDRDGEAEACATLSKVYTLSGEAHKAPHRMMGLDVLGKLVQAITNKDAVAFEELLQQLYMNMGVDKKDMEATLTPLFKKDPDAEEFFVENAFGHFKDVAKSRQKSHMCRARGYERTMLFTMMRYAAMGYGPSFRSVHATYRQGDQYTVPNMGTRALSVLKDETIDSWESVAMYQAHPGVMDAALQVQGVSFNPDPQ